ncbi:MAG: TetR/AcrR family transcriptional regulator [Saprospiraceae bacterium]|nr:TetR/AcrR family transcriptional regulator [Saprospiraceae bacterium]
MYLKLLYDMHHTLFRFTPNIRNDIYLKDPTSSLLGNNLIRHSIDLIDEVGLEEFNFKKLAQKTGTTEATIYRYFENKHKLLLYLTSWYWSWIEYQLMMRNTNIDSDEMKLRNAIQTIGTSSNFENESDFDLHKLFNIICQESSKAYMIKEVDELNKHGVFYNYKKIVANISVIIMRINPTYKYPNTLVTTIIEGMHHQIFFRKHLPSLTETHTDDINYVEYYTDLAFKMITTSNSKNK